MLEKTIEDNENIVGLFLKAASTFPDKIAIIDSGELVSFGELEHQVRITSSYFKGKGIEAGDRVLVLVPMSSDLYRVVLALFMIGATAVFLDRWVGFKKLGEYCKKVGCKGLVGGRKVRLLSLLSGSLRDIPIKIHSRLKHNNDPLFQTYPVSKSDTALVTFTTGSTGNPKAAKRSHNSLDEQFKALRDILKPENSETDLPLLPIVLLINLAVGKTSVIARLKSGKPNKSHAIELVKLINKYKVDTISASPYFIKVLAEEILDKSHNLPLKKVFTGGAPVFPKEAKLFKQAYNNALVKVIYGCTEAEPISTINADEIAINFNGLAVGIPYSKTKTAIIGLKEKPLGRLEDDDFNRLILRPGEIGEIIVCGPHVLEEYFEDQEADRNSKILYQGQIWHRTGDCGFKNEKGELFISGRCNSLIFKNGKIISPFVIEHFLTEQVGINIGTVVELQEEVILVIEPEKKTNSNKIKTEIIKKSINFDKILFVKEIPRDKRHFSKIDYNNLKRSLSPLKD